MSKSHVRHRHHKKWQFLTGLLFVLAGVGCTRLLEHFHLLAWPQRALLDSMPATVASTPSDRVVIVAINDDDYRELFQRRSPLDPLEVSKIIGAIQFFAPQIIGVDLDTEDWKPQDVARIPAGRGLMVWARLFTAAEGGPLRIASLDPVLGSDGAKICYGLTAMQADPDLRVRQYPGEYWMSSGSQVVAYPSFPVVVQNMMADGTCPKVSDPRAETAPTEANWDENRLLIRYRGAGQEIRTIAAAALLETRDIAEKDFHNPVVRPISTLIGGSVVLLGGTYQAGRDFYPTPVGSVAGVEILAHAILTEKTGPIKEAGSRLLWFDVCLGLSLVVLGLWYPRLATAVNLSLLVLMIPISGWLFRGFSFFLDAIPVQLSVLLHSTMHPALEGQLERLEQKFMKAEPRT